MARICVRTENSYLCPDRGLEFLSEQRTRICIRTKDSYFCPGKDSYLCPNKGLEFLSGQRTRICIRAKDSNFCPDKELVFVSGQRTRICKGHWKLYIQNAQICGGSDATRSAGFEPRDFRLSSMCVNHAGAMFSKESTFALLLNDWPPY